MLIIGREKTLEETLADLEKLKADLYKRNEELIKQGKRIQRG